MTRTILQCPVCHWGYVEDEVHEHVTPKPPPVHASHYPFVAYEPAWEGTSCRNCGFEFKNDTGRARMYCSIECANAFNRRKHKLEKYEARRTA